MREDRSKGEKCLALTCRYARSVAWCHVLSCLSLVTRGKRMLMPSAVWMLWRVNSAPVTSHTGEL